MFFIQIIVQFALSLSEKMSQMGRFSLHGLNTFPRPKEEVPAKVAESLPDTVSVATEGPDELTNERSTPTDGPDSEAVGKSVTNFIIFIVRLRTKATISTNRLRVPLVSVNQRRAFL